MGDIHVGKPGTGPRGGSCIVTELGGHGDRRAVTSADMLHGEAL